MTRVYVRFIRIADALLAALVSKNLSKELRKRNLAGMEYSRRFIHVPSYAKNANALLLQSEAVFNADVERISW